MKTIIAFLIMVCSIFAMAGSVPDCEILPHKGCWLKQHASPGKMLVYLRGHYQGSGKIPPAMISKSALGAVAAHRLSELAQNLGLSIFVTGSSHLAIDLSDLAILSAKDDRWVDEVILAAHSGGYVGLWHTLELLHASGVRITQILMLDNWYSTMTPFHELLGEYVRSGTACSGFHTLHNHQRYLSHYLPLGCQSQGPQGFDHSLSVFPFLRDVLTRP